MEEKKITRCFFRFEITQSIKVLMYKINQGDGRRWNIDGEEERGRILLREIGRSVNSTLVLLGDGYMRIITAFDGYEYMIEDKEGGGAIVSFQGPVNALLAQALMPRMTYVPGTLRAMSEDMPDYGSIAEFMEIRAERNADSPNPQDRHGWRVNMKFNNELVPWLPPFNGERRENPKKQRRKERAGKFARR